MSPSLATTAHRASWILFRGEIPENVDICHSCDNRKCVNPEHLFVGSRKENMNDCRNKGRMSVGEDRYNAVLTKKDVIVARKLAMDGMTHRALAERYGVSRRHMGDIVNGKRWADV